MLLVLTVLAAATVVAVPPAEPAATERSAAEREAAEAKAADAVAQAQELNELAMQVFHDGDPGRAARIFDAAYAIDPWPSLLWNSARAYDRAGEAREAMARYEQALSDERIEPKRRDTAKQRLVQLRRILGLPPVTEAPPDSKSGDGAGDTGASETANLGPASGSDGTVAIPPLPPNEPERPITSWEIAGWSTLGIGVAAAAIGGVFYGTAQQDARELRDALAETSASPIAPYELSHRTAQAKADKAAESELIGWALMGAGAAVLTTGALLVALAPEAELAPAVVPTGDSVSVSLSGRF